MKCCTDASDAQSRRGADQDVYKSDLRHDSSSCGAHAKERLCWLLQCVQPAHQLCSMSSVCNMCVACVQHVCNMCSLTSFHTALSECGRVTVTLHADVQHAHVLGGTAHKVQVTSSFH